SCPPGGFSEGAVKSPASNPWSPGGPVMYTCRAGCGTPDEPRTFQGGRHGDADRNGREEDLRASARRGQARVGAADPPRGRRLLRHVLRARLGRHGRGGRKRWGGAGGEG